LEGGSPEPRAPGLGRNTLNGPAFAAVDMRFTRDIALFTERAKLKLMFEAFNLTNRANYNAINTAQFNLRERDPYLHAQCGVPATDGNDRPEDPAARGEDHVLVRFNCGADWQSARRLATGARRVGNSPQLTKLPHNFK
jgi:hypothetical protein